MFVTSLIILVIMDSVSISVVLRKQRQLANSRYPIKLRVIYNRKSDYISLPLNLKDNLQATEEEWETIHSKNVRGDLKKVKLKIAAYEQRAIEVIENIEKSPYAYSFERFKQMFLNHRKSVTIFTIFDDVIADLKKQGRIGTAESYNTAKNSFLAFTGTDKTEIKEVTKEFLKKYLVYGEQNIGSINSVGIYLRTLKRMINTAIERGLLNRDEYPFYGFTIPKKATPKRALKIDQIKSIFEIDTIKGTPRWEAQQYFKLSFLLQGANFMDIAFLEHSNIVNGRIEYIRRKTHRTATEKIVISIKITSEIMSILDELAQQPSESRYLFPILNEKMTEEKKWKAEKQFIKRTNNYIKEMAKDIGLNFNVTTYVARHSYGTALKRMNVPLTMIQETLAHKNQKTTEIYLDSFVNEDIDNINEKLI